jgi:superfamily II DNA or RNA helicase
VSPKHPATRKYLDSGIFDGPTAFSELEQRISELPTDKERGDAFEVFAEAYLATQKINQAKEIWPEAELPPSLIEKFNLGRRKGVGVDGIYETATGDWFAYQVKFRSSRNLTFNEVSPFYGITEAFDQRVLITNCNRLASQIDDRPNAFCVRGNDFNRLERSDFEAIVQWLRSAVVEVEKKVPDPHQREALDTILPALTENDRISAIMACGTGKTLVTLWAAEQYGCKTLLVLVPSLALIRQTLHEWLAETSWSKMAYLCVCSDPSVQKGADDIVVRPSELDFPVSTDSSNVAGFMSRPFDGIKVVFSTYQSAPVVADGMNEDFAFDLGIFDEAHKTAGRQGKKNSFALDDANLAIRKRLFVTATPRHYSPTKRTKEGDQAVLYSMDKPEVYGPLERRYELSFAEAARRRIICDYKIIISEISYEAVTNALLSRGEVVVDGDSVRARQVANQLAIRNAIDKFGVKKIFSFHPRIRSAESFTSDRPEGINSIIPGLPAFHVNGKMNASDREAIMREFAAAPRGLVSNARCLTEGVDVPAVDMVAFMSPKKSKIDIIQATGRAMRLPRPRSDKTVGYVFMPLYIEQAKGETEEEAIRRLGFEELADVLNAMKEQDDVLVDILREMREERGRVGGYDDSRFREKVEVIGESIGLDLLRASITTMCVDHLGVTWDERYGQLIRYRAEYGDCNVPKKYPPNQALANWCFTQKALYENRSKPNPRYSLTDERFRKLTDIGFVFDLRKARAEERLAELRQFKEDNGHLNVPKDCQEYPKLYTWTLGIQFAYKQYLKSGKFTKSFDEDLFRQLVELEFPWNRLDLKWEEMFSRLVSYKNEHNHCNVPKEYDEDPELGSWCSRQITLFNKGKLKAYREKKLVAIGFVFDDWEVMFNELVLFKQKHGHCDVPHRHTQNGHKLGIWCGMQVRRYKARTDKKLREVDRLSPMSDDQMNRLSDLGFKLMGVRAAIWEQRFQELADFKEKHEHCFVSRELGAKPELINWCNYQRQQKKRGRLSKEQINKLESIGFKWSLR